MSETINDVERCIVREQFGETLLVCGVTLEQWEPMQEGNDVLLKPRPTHRLIYDALADELRVEWKNGGYGWVPCERLDVHLPHFGGGK